MGAIRVKFQGTSQHQSSGTSDPFSVSLRNPIHINRWMWNRTDAWNRCYQNTPQVDDKKYLSTYLSWCEQAFTSGDLFVTLNCPLIDNLSTFVFAKTSAIEKRVRAQQPEFNLYRIAVLVRRPQYHAHLILKSTEFSNDHYASFRDLVLKQFRKALKNDRDVCVQTIDNIYAVTRYELMKQDDCEIDSKSLFLPPTHNTH